MQIIRSIIVEDDPNDSRTLTELLENEERKTEIVSVCTNTPDAYRDIVRFKPDLVFLDIDLGAGESGFDLLKKFEFPEFAVIFTTQHSNYTNAVRAIKACAIHFLAKPLYGPDVKEALDLYEKNKKNNIAQLRTLKENLEGSDPSKKALWISNTEGKTKIEHQNIIYCESQNSYTHFHLVTPIGRKSLFTSAKSIKEWEKDLENTSIRRVHNQYLANLSYFVKYKPKLNGATLYLKNGIAIPVSKSRKEQVRQLLRLPPSGDNNPESG